MTLLITVFAAVISTLVWYVSEKARNMKISLLMYIVPYVAGRCCC